MCFGKGKHIQAVIVSLRTIPLDTLSRDALILQYNLLLQKYRKRVKKYSISFHILRIVITVGSLIVPALLSVQYTNGNTVTTDISVEMYWTVWLLSLFVTISNGILTLLKIDKKYYSLHTIYQQLLSEGWQFIHLSGKYSGQKTPGISPTHENQYPFFVHAIDKIHMKSVEDEYYKVNEANQGSAGESLTQQTPYSALMNGRRRTPGISTLGQGQGISQLEINGTPIRKQNSQKAPVEETTEGGHVDESDTSAVSVSSNVS
jgi:hypothetical protein